MRTIYILAFLIFSLTNVGFSQTMHEVKDYRFRQIADSLINSKTDTEFRKAIKYERTWECYYDTSNINSENWSGFKSVKGVNVDYAFIDSCDQTYVYRTKGLRRGGFEITFDLNRNIVEQPNFEFLKEVTTIHNKCFISSDIAQNVAIRYCKPKSRKTWTNQLVYDLLSNKVYWLIERESGFQNGVIETIKIDAQNQNLIEKTSTPYRKSFFEALGAKMFSAFIPTP